jgi:hypothetical protein
MRVYGLTRPDTAKKARTDDLDDTAHAPQLLRHELPGPRQRPRHLLRLPHRVHHAAARLATPPPPPAPSTSTACAAAAAATRLLEEEGQLLTLRYPRRHARPLGPHDGAHRRPQLPRRPLHLGAMCVCVFVCERWVVRVRVGVGC